MTANTANTANDIIESDSKSVARPIYFASTNRTLFGWTHIPTEAPRATTGVVICSPFGYEAICSHRSVRSFAQAIAAAGLPVLRFDYCGTGDSEDIEPNGDQLSAWSQDVIAAGDELRRSADVEHIYLLGFRLGVLVAAKAAASYAGIKGLIAIAPVTSGRNYLRELRTIQLASAKRTASAEKGGIHVAGFSLSAASIASLNTIDLTGLSVPDVLVVDRREAPAARTWCESLTSRGFRAEYLALTGFVRMMMTQPHLASVPHTMISAACDWLKRVAPAGTAGEIAAPPHRALIASRMSKTTWVLPDSSDPMTERLCVLGSEARLFGIVTEPRRSEKRRRGIILLNAGATHHVGPNRMYVTLARRWAQNGYVVLRFDLSGLGDSGSVKDQKENEVYPECAVAEIRAAVDFLRSQYGVNTISLAGLCSGAYHCLRAAVADTAVTRIMLVNPLNFLASDGTTQDDLLRLGFNHSPALYLRQNVPSKFWKKLMSGQVNIPRLLSVYARYGLELAKWSGRELARSLHLPVPGDLGNELQKIASRGVSIVFIFASGDPGIAVLRHQAGSAVKRLGAHCRIHTIADADHIFSQGGPRTLLETMLGEELFAPPLPAADALNPYNSKHVREVTVG